MNQVSSVNIQCMKSSFNCSNKPNFNSIKLQYLTQTSTTINFIIIESRFMIFFMFIDTHTMFEGDF